MFNPNQPIRPRLHPVNGKVLRYATFPPYDRLTNTFNVCSIQSMMSQCRLYRAARQGIIDLQVPIVDLHAYCFHDVNVSKNQMGKNVVRALIYESRLLANNKTVGKATMTYTFHTDLDLQYGLEWQICTWLRKFLNNGARPEDFIGMSEDHQKNREALEIELDDLVNSDHMEYLEIYESKFMSFSMEEPNWHKIVEELTEDLPKEAVEPRSFSAPLPRRLSVPNPS